MQEKGSLIIAKLGAEPYTGQKLANTRIYYPKRYDGYFNNMLQENVPGCQFT